MIFHCISRCFLYESNTGRQPSTRTRRCEPRVRTLPKRGRFGSTYSSSHGQSSRRGGTHGVACCHYALQTSEVTRARTLRGRTGRFFQDCGMEDPAATATILPGCRDQAIWYTWSQAIVQNASR
ncbi:uncharacterized protein C8Q71DRAFT_850153 [Rhodofomes roseus]|uniref:Uncharacterized protein n=1 Tax=Rhodofomes roseus TaxID=34475 RepID=A0ABQ8K728_9APHY|nr:uncharacterized protein C8Q71DRAFT_850153 [Rhodofomes roseus]KAH9833003.1 hypothetical protein C8Q71DRAFT_850153 [Rhodofomes roseus]